MIVKVSDNLEIELSFEQKIENEFTEQEIVDIGNTIITEVTDAIAYVISTGVINQQKIATRKEIHSGQIYVKLAGSDSPYIVHHKLLTVKEVTVVEVYGELVRWLDTMKESGHFDPELTDYARQRIIQHLSSLLPGDPTTDAPTPKPRKDDP